MNELFDNQKASVGRRVIGLDLSLTCTGWCITEGNQAIFSDTIKTKERAESRLVYLRNYICGLLADNPVSLGIIEGYAFGVAQAGMYAVGELGGVIRVMLYERHIPFISVPPSCLKQWATGKGNANKDMVTLAAERRWPGEITGNDQADAVWLADIAWHLANQKEPEEKFRQDVLKKIRNLK